MSNLEDEKELKRRLVELTRDLILIPGTEHRPKELLQALRWVGNHLEGIDGTEVVYYEKNGVHSLVAKPRGCEVPEVMMCSHVDVVHHADVGDYRSWIDDGLLWGPGAGDMKANLVMTLEVYKAIQEQRPKAPIAIAVSTDEEIGGENGTGYLFGEAGVRCKNAMVPDGGSVDKITIQEKGIMQVKLRTKGRSGHASRPWLGVNAVENMIDGIYHFEKKFRKQFPPKDDHWHSTFVVTIFKTDNNTTNRIPDQAEATLDFRFSAPTTPQDMMDFIADNLEEGIEHEIVVYADSTVLNPDKLYYQASEDVLGYPPYEERSDGASDARFLAAKGIPVIITRPVCGSLHCTDEWVDINSLVQLYHIYQRYLELKLDAVATD